MKNIALVIEHWGLGGTESYVKGLIKELLVSDYAVYLVLLQGGGENNIDFLPKKNVKIIPLKNVKSYLLEMNISVVSLHLYSRLLSAVLKFLVLDIKIISTLHMPINSWGFRQRIYWHLAARLSYKVVCVSPFIANQLGMNVDKVISIPGGIDEIFFQYERSLNRSSNLFRIAAVGRLSEEKEWLTLISAVNNLPSYYKKQIKIDFYGEGVQQEVLQHQIKENNINAHFYGHLSKDKLARELSNCSLSVLPSLFEGLGLSAIETMALGVPTITSDFESSSLYISDGVNGHRFPIRDYVKLSELIIWHIKNPNMSFVMGFNGRITSKEAFSVQKTYGQYIKLINKARL